MWLLAFLVPATTYFIYQSFRKRHRAEILAAPFPEKSIEFLTQNFPLYSLLPNQFKEELKNHIKVFLDDKQFIGCGGLQITDEIKVTIAAQACILLLNRQSEGYPNLRSIMVYPDEYTATETKREAGIEERRDSIRLGEAWVRGPIVLSWNSVLKGAVDSDDGHNVVFHEFAHNLDQEDGTSNGAPPLNSRSQYRSWARVLSKEFLKLKDADERGETSLIDKYGATNPAEFFAVVTEVFFEKSGALKRKHPELYEELQKFYNVDPASWHEGKFS